MVRAAALFYPRARRSPGARRGPRPWATPRREAARTGTRVLRGEVNSTQLNSTEGTRAHTGVRSESDAGEHLRPHPLQTLPSPDGGGVGHGSLPLPEEPSTTTIETITLGLLDKIANKIAQTINEWRAGVEACGGARTPPPTGRAHHLGGRLVRVWPAYPCVVSTLHRAFFLASPVGRWASRGPTVPES